MVSSLSLASLALMRVKQSSLDDSESLVDSIRYTLDNEQTIAEEAQCVPLSQEQIDQQLQTFGDATS